MKRGIVLQLFIFLCSANLLIGQSSKDSLNIKTTYSDFKEYYPIHVKPSISYLSNTSEFEDILFDAKPIVYYSFYNNMRHIMQNSDHKLSYAAYALFQPHIRMFSENSLPVKTPSYRLLFGFQGLVKTQNNNFFAWALESGHYSNGQSGCAFGAGLEDESEECRQIHLTINDQSNLSALLNRTNGNFSTNITKLSANFRLNNLNKEDKPYKVHSFSVSWELYHNLMFGFIDKGGYSDFDIDIYGRNRFGFEYEFIHTYTQKIRYSLGVKTEIIQGAHPFVEPFRGELNFTWYPFNRDIGVFAAFITGHDNYNYRLVDSGNQFSVGITWDWFTPFEIKRAEQIKKHQKKTY
ncbi:hypothetical protein [Aquimarina sediminis]|uniref:hypothetical protein n=1 Tax=Aquimarina sediminis TaxID=2070536 RepID=UPI000CA033D4|nr:hypothetical protein [Aquimarina sediminis]